jgi:hypothetical protein
MTDVVTADTLSLLKPYRDKTFTITQIMAKSLLDMKK